MFGSSTHPGGSLAWPASTNRLPVCRNSPPRQRRRVGSPRTHEACGATGSAACGDPHRRSRNVGAAGQTALDRPVLRIRSPPRTGWGPMHHRSRGRRRPPLRRRGYSVLPGRDVRLRVSGCPIMYRSITSTTRRAATSGCSLRPRRGRCFLALRPALGLDAVCRENPHGRTQ